MRSLRALSIFIIVGIIAMIFPSPPSVLADPVATAWNRKVEIIIQQTKIDATLTDFPVLLTKDNIPSEACDADGTYPAKNGGGDLHFTSDANGNSPLPLEIVDFVTNNNPANCVVEMYVKVPSISATEDTSIWMWYNTNDVSNSQPAPSDPAGSDNVWNSNYKGVWHLDESSGTRSDATSNNNDLTDNNTVASGSGKIGTAADFELDNTESLSRSDASQTGLDITGDMTFSTWVKLETVLSSPEALTFGSKFDTVGNQRGYIFRTENLSGTNYLSSVISDDGTDPGNTVERVTWSPSSSTWYHVGMSYDASAGEVAFFVNGQQHGSIQTGAKQSIYNNSASFRLGTWDALANMYDGLMDEFRIAAVETADAWFKAEYENANDPGAFMIEQTPADGTTAPPESSIIKPANQNITSSTTLTNDTDLTFTLAANTSYVVNGGLFATSASATPDIKIGFTVPTGATMDIAYMSQTGNNRTAELLETTNTPSSNIPIAANQTTIIQVFGSIVTGGSGGTLQLKWAQNTSNATATTMKQGSFMTVTEAIE